MKEYTISEQSIGMLRQWLNEERIDDVEKLVTNDQLKSCLTNTNPQPPIEGWEETLEGLKLKIPDGFYKDCEFYVEATKYLVSDIAKELQVKDNYYKEVLREILNLPTRCHNCDGTDKKHYGECICSYKHKNLISSKEIKEILKKHNITLTN